MLPKEEIVSEFEMFLNEMGLWSLFLNWASEKGYDATEFGFSDIEDNP